MSSYGVQCILCCSTQNERNQSTIAINVYILEAEVCKVALIR